MEPRQVLFIAEGQMGDLLLLTPALRSLKASYPSASISVLVLERHPPRDDSPVNFDNPIASDTERRTSVLSTHPAVSELYVLNRNALRERKGSARVRAEWSIIKFLRSRHFDTVICTFPEDRFTLWAFASGARNRIGQKQQGFAFLLSVAPDIRKDQQGVLQYYCDLVRETGATIVSHRTEFTIPDESRDWCDTYLRSVDLSPMQRLVAVHPGASGDYKIWPPERYAALIDYIQETLGARVLLLKGAQDAPVVTVLKEAATSAPVEVDTGGNIGHLAALMSSCALCVSNDSGPRHLAVALGVPSLAIFRQHHDREWKIYPDRPDCVVLKSDLSCPACPEGICLDKKPDGVRFGSYCTRMVSVEDVMARVRQLLKAS